MNWLLQKIDKSVLIESLTGAVLLAMGGILTVVLAGKATGVEISIAQSAAMNGIFFFSRLIGLYIIRFCFKKFFGPKE